MMTRLLCAVVCLWLAAAGHGTSAAEHPLQATIWQMPSRTPVNRDEVIALMHSKSFVLLGEIHDNPIHHILQTILTRAFIREFPHAVLAFEMIDTGQDATLRLALAENPRDAAPIGPALQWEKQGWPAWTHYQPIAQAALDHGATIRAANINRSVARAIARGEDVADLPPISSLSEPDQRRFERDIAQSHCNALPEKVLTGMVRAQQTRDAVMARAMGSGPAILIAGSGHVRTDRGVPTYLPSGASLSIAFVEVEDGKTQITDYAANDLPFDIVWFTERFPRPDPCRSLRP